MLGAVGGLSGWLWNAGGTVPAAILLAGVVIITAYVAGSRQDVDATTEVAALVVLAARTCRHGLGQARERDHSPPDVAARREVQAACAGAPDRR
jgi:hypothetical protein